MKPKETREEVIELIDRFDSLQADQLECPKCGDKYMHHVPYVNVPCKKCGLTYRADFKQDMYTKKARKIIAALSYNNLLTIKASERFEADINLIKAHYEKQKCWEVSNIKRDVEDHRRCTKCGTCNECFTCKDCKANFKNNPNRKKQQCTECDSINIERTYFKEVQIDGKNKICPNCHSNKIVMTRTKLKNKCHICNSTELSEPIKETIFILTIERKEGYKIL